MRRLVVARALDIDLAFWNERATAGTTFSSKATNGRTCA